VSFNLPVIDWIMGCVTSGSFAVLINGSESKFFKPTRGLRQGCYLSPLLFLIIAEGLSRAILEAKRVRAITGVNMGRALSLSHLLFVDDALLFSNVTIWEANKLQEILDLYSTTTGWK
jgi:hypothetical protein